MEFDWVHPRVIALWSLVTYPCDLTYCIEELTGPGRAPEVSSLDLILGSLSPRGALSAMSEDCVFTNQSLRPIYLNEYTASREPAHRVLSSL